MKHEFLRHTVSDTFQLKEQRCHKLPVNEINEDFARYSGSL